MQSSNPGGNCKVCPGTEEEEETGLCLFPETYPLAETVNTWICLNTTGSREDMDILTLLA